MNESEVGEGVSYQCCRVDLLLAQGCVRLTNLVIDSRLFRADWSLTPDHVGLSCDWPWAVQGGAVIDCTVKG